MAEVVIYHHCDADGFGAAAVIQSQYIEKGENDYHFTCPVITQVANFDFPMDFSLVTEETKELYILDYSISRQDDIDGLAEVLQKYPNCKLIYIDHHKTTGITMTKSKEIKESIEEGDGIYIDTEDFGYAGVFLAHIYVVHYSLGKDATHAALMHRINGKLCDCQEVDYVRTCLRELYENSPEWVQLISDHDAWQKRFLGSDAFVKGLSKDGLRNSLLNIENNTCFSVLYTQNKSWLNPFIKSDERKMVDYYRDQGNLILDTEATINRKCLRMNGYEIEITIQVSKDWIDPENKMKFTYDENGMTNEHGRFLCLNGYGNSATFLEHFEEYDGVILFSFDGETTMHSVYSRKENGFRCNLLALWAGKFIGISGGGHDHAAGWVDTFPTFMKDTHYTLKDDAREAEEIEKGEFYA